MRISVGTQSIMLHLEEWRESKVCTIFATLYFVRENDEEPAQNRDVSHSRPLYDCFIESFLYLVQPKLPHRHSFCAITSSHSFSLYNSSLRIFKAIERTMPSIHSPKMQRTTRLCAEVREKGWGINKKFMFFRTKFTPLQRCFLMKCWCLERSYLVQYGIRLNVPFRSCRYFNYCGFDVEKTGTAIFMKTCLYVLFKKISIESHSRKNLRIGINQTPFCRSIQDALNLSL